MILVIRFYYFGKTEKLDHKDHYKKTCALVPGVPCSVSEKQKGVRTEALLPTAYDVGNFASEARTAESDQGSQREEPRSTKRG